MASQTFEVDGFHRSLPILAGLLLMVAGVMVLLDAAGDASESAIGLLGLVAGAWWLFRFAFWVPHRVTLDDSGLRMESVARQVHIPWQDLKTVEPTPWSLRRQTLRWRRANGRAVMTLNAFPRLHTMLTDVERRAPQAHVSS